MTKFAAKQRVKCGIHQQNKPPASRGHLLLGNARHMQQDPLGFLLHATHQYGDVISVHFLAWRAYLINHPTGVKHILQENHRHYNKDVIDYHVLKRLVGSGLLTNDGLAWLQQRQRMQVAFQQPRLAAMYPLITEATTKMLNDWEVSKVDEQPKEILTEMTRLTLNILSQALFSFDLSSQTALVGQAFVRTNQLLSDFLYAPLLLPLAFPTLRNRQFREARHILDEVVSNIIRQRREQTQQRDDLLSLLFKTHNKETAEPLPDRQLHDEVLTLLLAGHETTANALTWTWYLLAKNPDAEHQLYVELDEAWS